LQAIQLGLGQQGELHEERLRGAEKNLRRDVTVICKQLHESIEMLRGDCSVGFEVKAEKKKVNALEGALQEFEGQHQPKP